MSRLGRCFALPCLAASLLLAAAPAPGLEVHGYLRAGAGSVAGGDGRQACFFLPGAGAKYRLDNECETYGELSVSHAVAPADGRPGLRYLLMLNAAEHSEHGLGNVAQAARHIGRPNQNWFAVDLPNSGSGILDGAHLWLGKRFYRRTCTSTTSSTGTTVVAGSASRMSPSARPSSPTPCAATTVTARRRPTGAAC